MKKLFEITADQFITQGLRASVFQTFKEALFQLATGVDPFTIPGLLQGAPSPSDISGAVVTDTINYFLSGTGSSSYAYGYGDGGKIYRINLTNDALENLRSVANSTGSGFALMKSAIYYSRDGNLGKMTSIEAGSPTFDDAFASFTTTAAGTKHPLHTFANAVYAGDKDHIDSNDGTTHSDNVLDFESDMTTIDIDDDGYYLVIAVIKNAGSSLNKKINKIFFWDRFSPAPNIEWEIKEGEITGISKGEDQDGNPCMIAFAGSAKYKFRFDMAPVPMIEGGASSYAPITTSDLQPFAGGLGEWKGQKAWASNGKLWTYGRVLKDLPKIVCSPITLTGIKAFFVNGFGTIYASAANKLYKVSSGNSTTDLRTGVIDLGGPHLIEKIKVHTFYPLSSGQSIQVQMTSENTGTAEISETIQFSDGGDVIVYRTHIRDVSLQAHYTRVLLALGGSIAFKKIEVWGSEIDPMTLI